MRLDVLPEGAGHPAPELARDDCQHVHVDGATAGASKPASRSSAATRWAGLRLETCAARTPSGLDGSLICTVLEYFSS